jgi:hypothetical protein
MKRTFPAQELISGEVICGNCNWTWELLASIQNNVQLFINARLKRKILTLIHEAPRSEDVWGEWRYSFTQS